MPLGPLLPPDPYVEDMTSRRSFEVELWVILLESFAAYGQHAPLLEVIFPLRVLWISPLIVLAQL